MIKQVNNVNAPRSVVEKYPMDPRYIGYIKKHLPESIRKLSKDEICYFIALSFSIIKRESRFNPKIVNPDTGAVGLMQLMPSTARWVEDKWFNGKKHNLKDPESNIKLGLRYLAYLYDECGGRKYQTKMLASWNAGPAKTQRYINNKHNLPMIEVIKKHNKETAGFLAAVNVNYDVYSSNYSNVILATSSKFARNDQQVKLAAKSSPKKDLKLHKVALVKRPIKPVIINSRVQMASLSSYDAAKLFRSNFPDKNIKIEKAEVNARTVYRVHVCFSDPKQAENFLSWAKTNGYKDAWILS